MCKIKEVLRLRYELKIDQRQIARSCSIAASGSPARRSWALSPPTPSRHPGRIRHSADSGRRRTGFRGEAEQGSGLIPNTIPG